MCGSDVTSYQQVRADSTIFAGQLFCILLIFITVLSELVFRNDAECFSLSLIGEFVNQEEYLFNPICLLVSYYVVWSSVFLT